MPRSGAAVAATSGKQPDKAIGTIEAANTLLIEVLDVP